MSAGPSEERNFPHLHYDFLQPDRIRDAQKRRPDDPDYDPKTIYIPDSFLAKQTPVS
jgi:DNA mismatch repair protein MSH6